MKKLHTPSAHSMWSKKSKNSYEKAQSYVRRFLQWLDNLKERVILSELEVGPANMTGAEAVMEWRA